MVSGQQVSSTSLHVSFYFVSPLVLISTSGHTCVPIGSDLPGCFQMNPLMVLKVSLVGAFELTLTAEMKLSAPLLVLVSKALPSKPHEPDTTFDSGIYMDFVDVSILRAF